MDKVKIKCNMYNISEYNNKFYLMEQNKIKFGKEMERNLMDDEIIDSLIIMKELVV